MARAYDERENDTPMGSIGCLMNISPGSTKYWTPECEQAKKPCVGQVFPTLEGGIEFYTTYASTTGFDVRRASQKNDRQGQIMWKYVLCSRAGFKLSTSEGDGVGVESAEHNAQTKRRRVTNRVGCNTRIIFKRILGGYEVHAIEERHTHLLRKEE
ncbi:PREDICTED: putative protein FAR1-RELATED SEQUENCE 10 [Ipomoea nil]|uniref:putative protein FAR1-RELATED SEQUENCE 10 n=1 Tax=Ipomoea nil TaxID=35883 RepID=UPI000900A42F|nr:PREDICTED: putative protein FAR1-RELATED SEQUENCE 10 [Ipomoea nil]